MEIIDIMDSLKSLYDEGVIIGDFSNNNPPHIRLTSKGKNYIEIRDNQNKDENYKNTINNFVFPLLVIILGALILYYIYGIN